MRVDFCKSRESESKCGMESFPFSSVKQEKDQGSWSVGGRIEDEHGRLMEYKEGQEFSTHGESRPGL